MKVIEKIIVFEDYHYAEGNLEIKVAGQKRHESNNYEEFSVDKVFGSSFTVENKYKAPNRPLSITNNKVFSLPIGDEVPTYTKNGDHQNAYKVKFDEIIADDSFVDDDLNIIADRYNTVREGSTLYSTITIKAYGLIKTRREEIENEFLYEIFDRVEGNGKILVSPRKEYYEHGETVMVKAVPLKGEKFLGWEGDFENYTRNWIKFNIEKDTKFTGLFSELVEEFVHDNEEPVESENEDRNGTRTKGTSDGKPYGKGGIGPSGDMSDEGHKTNSKQSIFNDFLDGIGALFVALGYLLITLVVGAILFSLISLFQWHLIWILILVALIWFLPKMPSRFVNLGFLWRALGFLFNVTAGLLLLFSILFILGGVFVPDLKTDITPKPTPIPTVKEPIEIEKENSTFDYVNEIIWEDYDGNNYRTKLRINSDIVSYEKNKRELYPGVRKASDYDNLLSYLHKNSNGALFFVLRSMDSIRDANNIPRDKMPEVVVSMVQHIPYYAIMENTCNPFGYSDPDIRNILMTSPCEGNIRHGIKTPGEFLKDIKGDCDTRTLFLYTVLKKMGYDVAVFGSEFYKHSVLGINIPNVKGESFKNVNGINYYLWETTSKYNQIGNLSPEIKNTNYWHLNLK